MGRKTWESIPPKFRPLEGRTNVVLTTSSTASGSAAFPDNVVVASSLADATTKLEKLDNLGHVFVIGGGKVYEESIESGFVNRVIYTKVSNIPNDTKFDAFFPELKEDEWECRPFQSNDKENSADSEDVHTDKKSGMTYEFLNYVKKTRQTTLIEEGPEVNPEEMQYLDLCREIMESGVSMAEIVWYYVFGISLYEYLHVLLSIPDSTGRSNWNWHLVQVWYSDALLAS